ncbi:MAG: carboxypeptidase regulatory-like domain-containing protein, partial [Planctomycetia bacterium]|nr:carboxypeptidase regulatory-like domain-containing protein [Planctomycetia bacterium]
MSRGQWIVLVVFLALTGGFAAVLLPELTRPALPPQAPPVERPLPPRAAGDPRAPRPSEGTGPRVPSSATAPGAPGFPVAPPEVPLVVEAPDGRSVVDATLLRVEGGRLARRADGSMAIARTAAEVWVGAPGHRFARATDVVRAAVREGREGGAGAERAAAARVRLEAAGPAIVVTVVEADGTPAPDVPVRWPGPDGRPAARRTDAAGHVVVDDQPAGFVVVSVGGSERGGPTLRLVVGEDRAATARLEPPFVVEGRVVDPEGFGVAGATVTSRTEAGVGGRPVVTDAEGRFRWVGRLTDHLALVASSGPREAAVRVPVPPPEGPLRREVRIAFPVIAPAVAVFVDRRDLPADAVATVTVEPAALALAREAFSPFEVGVAPFTGPADGALLGVSRADLMGPARVSFAGEVVPEDHLLPPAGGRREDLRVTLRPAAGDARPAPPPPAAGPAPTTGASAAAAPKLGALVGRVVDAAGAALPAVTVAAGGVRAVTAADGRFTLAGLPAGERVEVVAGWVDGATPGTTDPRPFAPWSSAAGRVGGDAVTVVLPRAAGVRFRAVRGIDGVPLAWVRAVVLDGAGDLRFDGIVPLAAGEGRLEGLVPGTPGTLSLFAPGLRREGPLALRAGETGDAGEVGLVRGVRVEGTVRNAAGAGVDAVVALLDDGRAESAGRQVARAREDALRAAAGREFVLEGLDPARPVGLAVFAPGFAPAVRRVIPDAEGVGRVAVTLVPGTRLRIRVEDPKRAPVAGAIVEIRDARAGVRWLDLWSRAAGRGFGGGAGDVAPATPARYTEVPPPP